MKSLFILLFTLTSFSIFSAENIEYTTVKGDEQNLSIFCISGSKGTVFNKHNLRIINLDVDSKVITYATHDGKEGFVVNSSCKVTINK